MKASRTKNQPRQARIKRNRLSSGTPAGALASQRKTADTLVSPKDMSYGDLSRIMTHNSPLVMRALLEAERLGTPEPIRTLLTRPRRNQKSLTSAEKNAFNRAIKSALADGTYQQLAAIHTDMTHDMHSAMGNTPSPTGLQRFLPWHRVYLYKMEQLLQTHEPYLRIPYWDWANDQPNWDSNINDWDWANNPNVPSWVFQPPDTYRNPGGDFVGPSTNYRLPNQLEVDVTCKYPTYTEFTGTLEKEVVPGLEARHDRVHLWVGGTMRNIMSSPKDPIFWLHHANIDRIWTIWNPYPKAGEVRHAADIARKAPLLTGPAASMDPWSQYTTDNIVNTLDLYYYYA